MDRHRYLFALTYTDRVDGFVGFVLVEAAGESVEQASREIERSKGDSDWLLAAFRAQSHEDIDGFTVGEHVAIARVVGDHQQLDQAESTR